MTIREFYMIMIIFIFNIVVYLSNYNRIRYYVMISSYGDYNIYLPLVSHFWIKLNIKPIVTIVYHKYDYTIPFITSALKSEGAKVVVKYIRNSTNLNYYSRIERIFNFYRVEDKKGIYITSDADIIPMNKLFFERINYNKFNIKSIGIKGYGTGRANKRWPMCYFISNVNIWKKILQLNNSITKLNIDEYEDELMNYYLEKGVDYYDGSFHRIDEIYMRDKIRNSSLFPRDVIFNIRNFRKTRIIKEEWKKIPQMVNWSNIYDIHIPTHLSNYTKIWLEIIKLIEYYKIKNYNMNYFFRYFSHRK